MKSALAWVQGAWGLALVASGCAVDVADVTAAQQAVEESSGSSDSSGGATDSSGGGYHPVAPPGAVGLALEVENGAGTPLQLRAGQTYWLDQLDIRTFLDTSVDEGVAGLDASGDFAALPWAGVSFVEQEPEPIPNADGTFIQRRVYRNAFWMEQLSYFTLQQLDASNHPVGAPLLVSSGLDDRRRDSDDFFVRRLRALQWVNDCPTLPACTGATHYQEEALVELRNSTSPNRTFTLDARTASFALSWTMRPGAPWIIPVTQVARPALAYGFSIDLTPQTPPRADGTYAPGSAITFRVTLRDGAGARLHPLGALPRYSDVVFGGDTSGIQYYRGFFDPTITYYRRKHRERQLLADFMGPAQSIQPIRSLVSVESVLDPSTDTEVVATLTRDGVYGELRAFPTASKLFGGAFDPTHAAWFDPVPDTFQFHVPAGAPAGTYIATIKGRRTFMGQDIPFTRNVNVQVGTPTPTAPTLGTGNCGQCHTGTSSLATILHANDNRGSCHACHAPLAFEYEGPIYVRTHFIHSRSQRIDADVSSCALCHLSRSSIQRTSKSACLSCHTSYPASHVQQFGAISSIFIGGGPGDSFTQCTTTCHRNHPGSGL
jgi:hypothetical protein